MKRFLIIILLFAVCNSGLLAQYDAQLSNFWAGTSYFNPGYAGHSTNLEATALYRQQWMGIKNAPRTILLSAEMPYKFFDRIHGLGVVMFTEKIGLFDHTIISGQYAYKTKLFKGDFSVGLQVGYIKEAFKGSEVNLDEFKDGDHQAIDPDIPDKDVSGTGLDVSLGAFYARKSWYAGLSVSHLTAPQLTLGENYLIDVPRVFYLTGGYNIQLNNPLLELRSALLIKTMAQGSITSAMKTNEIALSLRMIYNKLFWGGLGWRYDDALAISLGGYFKAFQVGYAYDFPTTAILKGSTGSHELFIKYTIDLNLGKGKRNKHKSVRIL